MYKENKNLEEQIIQQTESGTDTINSLGLCLGASTVSIVHMAMKKSENKPRIVKSSLHTHEGDPKQTLLAALKNFDLKSFDRIAATGRKFCKFVNLSSIPEPEAVELAYEFVKPKSISCPAIVSAGG
jgi:hypothetical protein